MTEKIEYCLLFGEELGMCDALTVSLKKKLEIVETLYNVNPKLQIMVSGDGRRLVGNVPKIIYQYLVLRLNIPEEQIMVDEEGYTLVDRFAHMKKWAGDSEFIFIADKWKFKRCNLICRKMRLHGRGVCLEDIDIYEEEYYRKQESVARLEDGIELTFGKKRLYGLLKKCRFILAILAGKAQYRKLRKKEEDPMSFPGKIATKICPEILENLTRNIKIIIVTGTNGKTSTCRLLEQQLKAQGISAFSNRSSANTYMGVTAEFLIHSSLRGRYKEQYAVIECDEGNFPKIAFRFRNENITILVTNLFRDQLDRYGELDFTRKSILSGILDIPQAELILNADCSMTAGLAAMVPNVCHFFGMNVQKEEKISGFTPDAVFCPKCGEVYTYSSVIYAHLGDYFCPGCGFKRPERKYLLEEREDGSFDFLADGQVWNDVVKEQDVPYYCMYNSLGVASVLMHLGKTETVPDCFTTSFYNPGRFEKVTVDQCDFYIILVKNAVGYQQAMKRLPENLSGCDLVFGLNDRANDGMDVSWIWDCDFSKLRERITDNTGISVFGDRYANMAVRLKYADFDVDNINKDERFSRLFEQLKKPGRSVYVFGNYTAMFSVRVFFARRLGLKKFWEEE